MSRELIDRTQGKWRGILSSLGIDGSYLTGKHRPCPMCAGNDRFRFDDMKGSGSWFCNQCGSGYGIHLVQRALGLTLFQAMSAVETALGGLTVSQADTKSSSPAKADHAKLASLWNDGIPLGDQTLAWRYLESRSLRPSADFRGLRFTSRQIYLDEEGNFAGHFPVMLGLIQGPDDKLAGIHRTYLAKNGLGQALVPYPKKVLGKIPDGAAIRLFRRAKHLGVAEGIETALSAHRLFGIPAWATVAAGALEKWLPPEGVEQVTVFGDNDKSFTGQKSAYVLANKLAQRGYLVDVKIPVRTGDDWNDVLRQGAEVRL